MARGPRFVNGKEMSILNTLKDAAQRLSEAGIETARLDAEILLAHAIGSDRSSILLLRDEEPDEEALARFASFIERRARGCPVAYITGVKEFWSRSIRVSPDVLVPRPESETVVEEALKIARELKRPAAALDLCTGSGCIAAALAAELPAASISVSDISAPALETARVNLAFAGRRIRLFCGDLFAPIEAGRAGPFDIITANPPYVSDEEAGSLPRDIRDFEPPQALLAGPDGLDFICRILEDAPRHLVPGGWLLMEIGCGQSAAAVSIAAGTEGYDTIRTAEDLAGIERVVMARRNLF